MKITRDEEFRIYAAPLQGFTEHPFRRAHAELYGHCDGSVAEMEYFTPFVRVEKGKVRGRDLRDADAALGLQVRVTPQVICRDADEFRVAVDTLVEHGHRRIDLNLGCPFPPQVKRGRGAGLLLRPECLSEIALEMDRWKSDVDFFVKMRVGVRDSAEWQLAVERVNAMPLRFVTVHPRTAAQQYRGELDMAAFAEIAQALAHKVIFNGEIHSPSDIDELRGRFPGLHGVMTGRGLLCRPSLAAEWYEGEEWPVKKRREMTLQLHERLREEYDTRLSGGPLQLLAKLKPMWEYFGADFDRKAVKKVVKAGTLAGYDAAVKAL